MCSRLKKKLGVLCSYSVLPKAKATCSSLLFPRDHSIAVHLWRWLGWDSEWRSSGNEPQNPASFNMYLNRLVVCVTLWYTQSYIYVFLVIGFCISAVCFPAPDEAHLDQNHIHAVWSLLTWCSMITSYMRYHKEYWMKCGHWEFLLQDCMYFTPPLLSILQASKSSTGTLF